MDLASDVDALTRSEVEVFDRNPVLGFLDLLFRILADEPDFLPFALQLRCDQLSELEDRIVGVELDDGLLRDVCAKRDVVDGVDGDALTTFEARMRLQAPDSTHLGHVENHFQKVQNSAHLSSVQFFHF